MNLALQALSVKKPDAQDQVTGLPVNYSVVERAEVRLTNILLQRSNDWLFKPLRLRVAAGGFGYGDLLGTFYAEGSGFFASYILSGAIGGLALGVNGTFSDEWYRVRAEQLFSPWDLHGANGTMKFLTAEIGSGAWEGWIYARRPGSQSYLFSDQGVGEIGGIGLSIGAGYLRGIWRSNSTFAEGTRPVQREHETLEYDAG
jgi:hypothetical protein